MEFILEKPTTTHALAEQYGLTIGGSQREIVAMATLSAPSVHREQMVTFATSPKWALELPPGIAACIVATDTRAHLPDGCTALITEADPAEVFYEAFCDSVEDGRWQKLEEDRGTGVMIAASATVHPGVQIGDNCSVMDGAVLMPNSRLGDRVTVKPNAIIGGEGFQVRRIRGRRRIVPHAGGVDIGSDCSIGSQTCVDRGLFGDATTLQDEVMVDNLIHIAHSVSVGRGSSIIACAEISGSVNLGAGVWVGPNTSINPGVSLGDHSYIGTGSTVVRDIPANALAYGSPARFAAWICDCYTKLPETHGTVSCPACGITYLIGTGGPQRVG